MKTPPAIPSVLNVHPYAWLWEPLETDPGFLLNPMFGFRALYLDGLIMLVFCAKEDPWHGLLVCTDRNRHVDLISEFPSLSPHTVLSKWLYLAEKTEGFERIASRLVELAGKRDPRIGVLPKSKNQGRKKFSPESFR